MSRSTRSSTRLREGVAFDPIAGSLTTINGLIESFVNSATEVEMQIFSEMTALSNPEQNLLLFLGSDKEGTSTEKLCSRISHINNQHKNSRLLRKAEKVWRQLIQDNPISLLLKLDVRKRRDISSAGRNIASSLFITGNIYSGLTILKEIVEINDHDPHSSVVLLRWLVRYGEWEAMEKFLESDRQRKKSNFDGFEELVELCSDILDFHRYPKGREEKVVKMMQLCDNLNNTKDKSIQVFEAQILLYNVFSLASKIAGIKQSSMLDPLYCLENAYIKAETVVKSRWSTFVYDKQLDGLKTKSGNSVEYLKTASSVAEYFDVLRLNVNEYVRCAILREPVQTAYFGLCYAIKLGFPMWITEALTLLLSARVRSEADKEELDVVKKWINSIFSEQGDQKEKEQVTCISHIVGHFNKLSLFSDDTHHHIHPVSSSCGCYLCLESSFNPAFSFFCSKLSLLCSGHSIDAINSLVSNYDRIRSAFAPLQRKLMNVKADKPRPPSWICDEMGQSIVSFLLSPTGLSLPRKDSNRVKLLTVGDKICSYSSHLCLPYRLVLRNLTRHSREAPSFPWMNRRSIMTKLADLSMGSEGRGRRTPSRSPFTPISLNTPNRSKTATRDRETDKEDKEEKNEYEVYGHLLYHDWRSRTCEQLCIKSVDPWAKAMFLSESVAVATREARRLINGNIKPFGFHHVKEFKSAVEKMPADMTVNELIVTMSGDLYFVKIHSKAVPIVVPLARETKWSLIMDGFNRAMDKGDETAQAGKELKGDARKYWEGRRKADELMRRAMVDMESDLLGAFSPLLLPTRILTKKGVSLATQLGKGGVRSDLCREMVAIAAQTTPSQYKQLVECMGLVERWSDPQVEALLTLQKSMEKGESSQWIEPIKDLPFVFFVLSTELSRSPWEAVTILDGKAHCSRLVSIHQLLSLLHSFNKVPYSANPLSAFYILDPGNDLAATTTRLTPVVESVPSWKGVTGKGPDKSQVGSIISENDFFIFLGHGNGLRYLSRSVIRKSRCRAVVLLMGCSSAHTIHEGRGMDGKGAVLDYSVASCPCIVGCNYMVTDGEIDRYFTAFVDEGLGRHLHETDSTPTSELRLHLEAMAKARTKVKLPYLTGSAVVSYGIPIDIRVQSSA